MFYVLDGVLTMQLGEDTLQFEAGTFVCVPPGVKHTFSNPSDTAVRFLNFNTPAGWEGYMRDLAAAAKTARSRRRRSDASPPITTFTRAEPHAIATLCAERP